MIDVRTPEQIASDIVGERTRGSTATVAEVLAIVRDAINADRAQRPAPETWEVFCKSYPNIVVLRPVCDEDTVSELVRAYSADENNCGAVYGYRKVESE